MSLTAIVLPSTPPFSPRDDEGHLPLERGGEVRGELLVHRQAVEVPGLVHVLPELHPQLTSNCGRIAKAGVGSWSTCLASHWAF